MSVRSKDSEFVRCTGCGAQVRGFGEATVGTAEMRVWCRGCTSIREAMATFPYRGNQRFPDRRAAVVEA